MTPTRYGPSQTLNAIEVLGVCWDTVQPASNSIAEVTWITEKATLCL
jgi:hypothetical protein